MVSFVLNGKPVAADADPQTPLLWIVRDHIGLTGTKYGCGAGLCGACTVHVDGKPARSCQLPVSRVGESSITTIEGIGDTPVGKRLQAAWLEVDTPQCGYCQGGQIMSAAALLARKPHPTDQDIDAAMTGNICRCHTYLRIRAAIKQAASMRGGDVGSL